MENKQLKSRVQVLEEKVKELELKNLKISEARDNALKANEELNKRLAELEEAKRQLMAQRDSLSLMNTATGSPGLSAE